MDAVKTLRARAATFEFHTDANQWCRVTLVHRDQRVPLGADTFPVLMTRLQSFLEQRDKLPQGSVDRRLSWKWIASLSELHCSLYARLSDGHYAIMIEDQEARLIAEFVIDEGEAERWDGELAQWAQEFPATK